MNSVTLCIFFLLVIMMEARLVQAKCNQQASVPTVILRSPVGQNIDLHKLNNTFVVPNQVKSFILNCSHQDPIDWEFEGVMANTLVEVSRGVSYGEFWKFNNPCFYMALEFKGVQDEITGTYKCINQIDKSAVESVQIFSGPDEGKPRFVLHGKSFNITASLRATEVEFPCAVTNPTALVDLFHRNTHSTEWVKFPKNKILSFKPLLGYEIRLENSVELGDYKCVIQGDLDGNEVFIHLHRQPQYLVLPEYLMESKPINVPADSKFPYVFKCMATFPVYLKIVNLNSSQATVQGNITITTTNLLPHRATLGLTYTGGKYPIERVNEVQCLNNQTNEVLYRWKFMWSGTTSRRVGMSIDDRKMETFCISAVLDELKVYYIPCNILTECRFRQKCLDDDANSKCSANYSVLLKMEDISVTERRIKLNQSGTIKCRAREYSFYREVFLRTDRKGLSADIESRNEGVIGDSRISTQTINVGDYLTLECWMVQRAFLEGPIFAFEWKDDIVTEVPPAQITTSTFEKSEGIIYRSASIVVLDKNVKEVGCVNLELDKDNDLIPVRVMLEINIVGKDDNAQGGGISKGEGYSVGSFIGTVIGCLLLIACISVGIFFFSQARKNCLSFPSRFDDHSFQSIPLTTNDIEEFRNGKKDLVSVSTAKNSYETALNGPFDVKYEILKSQLEFYNGEVLGEGAYGMVIKGRVSGGQFLTPLVVAIKTIQSNAEPEYIRALLMELKIMTYLGSHKHILELLGACTENLKQKELYIVLQLCSNGGLNQYLHNHRDVFVNQIEKGQWINTKIEEMYANTHQGSLFTAHLIRWGYQISSGMEYLAMKKVIHGDLATRNVLLDEFMVAKISDFGLARQLYEYSQYVKKQQAPLPWRWMAIESLRDLKFSTQSDVWSFGVTLWELMTLAETPHPGLMWNPQFISTLLDGYRMSKPKYAPSEVYVMMLNCWREKPEDRVSFTELTEQLLEILETNFRPEFYNL